MADQAVNKTAQQRIDIITAFLTKIGNMDFAGAGEHLHENAEFVLPYLDSVAPMRSREEFILRLSSTAPLLHERMDFTFNAWYPGLDPDIVVTEYQSRCPLLDGKGIYENQYISVARFKDDKIILYKEYLNPLNLKFE